MIPYSVLKRADTEQDTQARAKAVKAYEILFNFLKEEEEKYNAAFEAYLDKSLKTGGNWDFTYVSPLLRATDTGFLISCRDLGIPETQYPLDIWVDIQTRFRHPAFAWYGETNHALLCFNTLISEHNLSHAATRIPRTVFIHEFIHYLDASRTNRRQPGSHKQNDIDSYYNSPAEMNAFYQESIDSVIRVVTHLIQDGNETATQAFFGGYETFYRFVIRFFDQGWVHSLSAESRRKIQKRLYGVYRELLKKF